MEGDRRQGQTRAEGKGTGHLKAIKTKSKLYKKYLLNPSPENTTLYKHFKNKLNHSLKMPNNYIMKEN